MDRPRMVGEALNGRRGSAFRLAFVGSAASTFIGGRSCVTLGRAAARRPARARQCRRPGVIVTKLPPTMMFSRDDGEKPPPGDRFLSALPYLVPTLDALQYGAYLFQKFPPLREAILTPLGPLFALYRGIPLLDLAIFFSIYFFIVRNRNLSRFVRFNSQQAILLDVVLIIPGLFGGLSATIPKVVSETASNSIFYGMLLCVGYCVAENVRGSLPNRLPVISQSVDQMLGPF